MMRPIPTVRDLPPLSGLRALVHLRHGLSGLLPALEHVHRTLGDVFQLKLGRFQPIFIASPDLIREALTVKRDALNWRVPQDPVVHLFGDGLLVTDGDKHDRLYAQMQPVNERSFFTKHHETLIETIDREIDTWERTKWLDVQHNVRLLTLNVFLRHYFSTDVSLEKRRELLPIIEKTLRYIGPGFWIVHGHTPKLPQEAKSLIDFLTDLLKKRKRDLKSIDPDKNVGARNDLIQTLLSAYPDDDAQPLIVSQMLTMLIAGHDTTTAHLNWTLLLLAAHDDWRYQVVQDIDRLLGARPPQPEALSQLVKLDQTIRESLRLYPPIHVGNRRVTEDLTLGSYLIPAGSRLMLSYYLVHRHPAYWQDAGHFFPERWSASFRPYPFSYVPFGGGPRHCIGAPFAQYESRLILTRILQRLDLKHMELHPYRTSMGASLGMVPRLMLQVEERSNRS
ncbi:MAG: cytochrome P450 [Candidatus Carbobacillus sp.]|nr:cytochrome P450 [Candidatus Carbobacillus sp.]